MGLHGAVAATPLQRENAVHVSSRHQPSSTPHIERYVDAKAAGDFLGLQVLLLGKGDGLLHRSKPANN
jgi:hypothetical protein